VNGNAEAGAEGIGDNFCAGIVAHRHVGHAHHESFAWRRNDPSACRWHKLNQLHSPGSRALTVADAGFCRSWNIFNVAEHGARSSAPRPASIVCLATAVIGKDRRGLRKVLPPENFCRQHSSCGRFLPTGVRDELSLREPSEMSAILNESKPADAAETAAAPSRPAVKPWGAEQELFW